MLRLLAQRWTRAIELGGAGWADWLGTELMIGCQQINKEGQSSTNRAAQPTAIQPEGNAFREKLCKVLRCGMGYVQAAGLEVHLSIRN